MKKIITLTVILFTSLTAVFSQSPDAVRGVWLNENKDAKIEIYKAADKYAGKIVWTKDMYEADGKTPKVDKRNGVEALRSRPILNLVILTGFKYDDGEWEHGEIYDPKGGKTYSSKMKLNGDKLEIRGYVGFSAFGRTTVWSRSQ